MRRLPLVRWHCWLGGRKGIQPVKKYGGWWRWALVSPDGVAPRRMVGVSASVNLPLHHNVQKFSSGTGWLRWSQKKGHKRVVMWWWWFVKCIMYNRAETSQEQQPAPLQTRSTRWGDWRWSRAIATFMNWNVNDTATFVIFSLLFSRLPP